MTTKKATRSSKTIEETVNETVVAAATVTKEKVEEMQDNYSKAYEEYTAMNQNFYSVCIKASGLFAKGAEEVSKAYFDYVKETAESGIEATKAVLVAKTVNDALDVQTVYAKQAFDTLMAEGTKIGELSVKVANESFDPIKGQIQEAFEKALKVA
tara:strand:- start:280 stop:744 length:465 start_codon:yes stop_codon:yes gene_type:complete